MNSGNTTVVNGIRVSAPTTSNTTNATTTHNVSTPTSPTPNQSLYTGGNQVIANYNGDKIILGTPPTNCFFSGADFFFGSATGALAV